MEIKKEYYNCETCNSVLKREYVLCDGCKMRLINTINFGSFCLKTGEFLCFVCSMDKNCYE